MCPGIYREINMELDWSPEEDTFRQEVRAADHTAVIEAHEEVAGAGATA